MLIDVRGWLSIVLATLDLGRAALPLEPHAAAAHAIVGLPTAIAIILLAGVAEGIGTQTSVLLVSRVSRRNFFFNLLLAAVVFLLGAVAWIATIWLIVFLTLGTVESLGFLLRVVSIGFVPLMFGFLALAPFVGPVILYALHAWSFLLVLLAVERIYGLSLWEAFGCTFGGWVLLQLLRRITSRPVAFVARRVWSKASPAQPIGIDDIPLVLPVRIGSTAAAAEGEQ